MTINTVASTPLGRQIDSLDEIADDLITNVKINSAAAIAEAKLAFDTTAGHDHNGVNSRSISGLWTLVRAAEGLDENVAETELNTVTVAAGVANANDTYKIFITANRIGATGTTNIFPRFNSNSNNLDSAVLSTFNLVDGRVYSIEGKYISHPSNADILLNRGEFVDSDAATEAYTNFTSLLDFGANPITGEHTISLRGNAGHATTDLNWKWWVYRIIGV